VGLKAMTSTVQSVRPAELRSLILLPLIFAFARVILGLS